MFTLSSLTLIIALLIVQIDSSIIINTTIGQIEGDSTYHPNVNYFIGIPYAKPPINELRFKSPEPIIEAIGNKSNPFQAKHNFSTILATYPWCMQSTQPTTYTQSEDCLYLNIFTPKNAQYLLTNYTTMIWIHGGGYIVGSGLEPVYDFTNMVQFIGDIIVVTINYRLGAFGWFYDAAFNTGITGNYGYHDQKLAIKWVYDNIKYFGGNPDNINIFGESAGAGSVAIQLLYNRDGYIKSGIMQSNPPGFQTLSQYQRKNIPSQFNKLVNCTEYEVNSAQLLDCWQNLDANTIVMATETLVFTLSQSFGPMAETSELPYQPIWGFTNGQIDGIPPYIIGDNKHDGYHPLFPQPNNYQELLLYLKSLLFIGDKAIDTILQYYDVTQTHSGHTGSYNTDFAQIWTDLWRCQDRYQLKLLGDNITNNVYYYNFDVLDKDGWTGSSLCLNRTCHGTDVPYLIMPFKQYADNYSIDVGEEMQILWSNFAKTLSPNDDGSRNITNTWPIYTNSYGVNNYLDIEGYDEFNGKSTDTDEYVAICSFWDSVGYAGNYSISAEDTITVNTTIGQIKGNLGSNVNTFFGIPFAKPPIDELRFKSPEAITEPIGNETNPFQAKGVVVGPFENVSACIQLSLPPEFDANIYSEDCLYLNVFTPSDAEYLKTNYTVMIWIYGGGFSLGYISQFDATDFVKFIGDVIIVTINYRLGALGFMYDNMFNTGIVGNYGYEDQKLAIKWVYDNIEYFGGNPDNINIFGESAGGGAVALQLLYNKDGYIKSGIMQSPWAGPAFSYQTPTTWNDTISQFNEVTNCSKYELNPNQLLNCWRNLDTILTAQSIVSYEANFAWNAFMPTVETEELLYQPLFGFTNGKIDNIPPYMIGSNKDEYGGGYFFKSYQNALETVAKDIVEGDIEISAAILDYYNINQISFRNDTDYGDIGSHYWRCSIRNQLKLSGDETDNIYLYDFDVVNYNLSKLFFGYRPLCWNQTCHGVDIAYLWPSIDEDKLDNRTIEIGEIMQRLWSNFAKTLNPNDDGSGNEIIALWPEYQNMDGINNYLDFGYDQMSGKSTVSDEYSDFCAFWNKVGYAGNYSNPDQDTSTISTVIVNTSIGHIEGYTDTTKDINIFLAIPYAKPPVDELRFKSPEAITEPIGNESNPYNATVFDQKACIQPSNPLFASYITMSEDCLYLSMVTPSDAEYLKTNYTVMIWIHGGGYILGSGLDIDPSNFVSFIGDIIIVTINYRLGVLGFLYDNTFDTGIAGNFGYEDQKLAIKWVYDNIAYFGGNPDNINIFGESAGGGAVSLQLLYNKDGYIKSGIMQSPWAGPFAPYPTPSSWDNTISHFNELINCTEYESNSDQLINCWMNLDANIISSTIILGSGLQDFIPTVGTTELLYQPLFGFTNGEIDDIPPYIIGTNDGEGFQILDEFITWNNSYQGLLTTIANDMVNDTEIAASILDYYGITETESPFDSYVMDNAQIQSDVWRCSVRYQLKLLNDNGGDINDIYYYNFDVVDYELNKNVFYSFIPSCWNITCHAADLGYLFNRDYYYQFEEYDDETIAITHTMQRLWSNFAKYLDPNGNTGNDNYDIIWREYTDIDGTGNYLDFEGYNEYNQKSIFDDDRTDICSFWDKVGYSGQYSNPNKITSTDIDVNVTMHEQETEEQQDKDDETWFIVGIIFIVLFVITLIIIGYLIYLLKNNRVNDTNDGKGGYNKTNDVELA